MKTHNGIAKVATAAAVLLMASCSMPVQVPVQTQQQQQNTQSLVEQLRKLVQGPSQANKTYPWEEIVADPLAAPQPLPQVIWPALGAGDFAQAQPQWLVGPVKDSQLPAPVAGINPNIVIPELLPSVVWPEKVASQPTYWHTVGVDERELVPPVAAPVLIQKAGEDLLDRHPAPRLIQKAGEDLLDRHPVNVAPPAPRAVPAGIRPETLEPVGNGKTDLVRVPGPVDDCPIRPAAGPC